MTEIADWTERGRELGATLGGCHAVVVVGEDPVATAEVALGIARVQAALRRVAIADLIGEAAPLQSLVSGDDPHGIVDSFEFGVSLNKITQAVADSGQLFVMPSGSVPIEHEELLPNPRWKRLSGGFRQEGALLVLVAPADAARLRDLVDATDGLILVGDAVPADITVAQSIAWLRTRKTSRPSVAGSAPLVVLEAARARPLLQRRRFVNASAGALITAALAVGGLWIARRPFVRGGAPARAVSQPTVTATVARGILNVDSVAVALADSVRRDSLARTGNVAASMAALPTVMVINPADSLHSSAWAVVLGQTTTPAGAILNIRGRFETVPAGTYAFDSLAHVYWLIAGAYPNRAGADSLLAQLRTRKVLATGQGSVASLPFAYLVRANVPAADVASRLVGFAGRGQPVYALRQANGSANLYFGAYESAREAALVEAKVREAGLTPTLVYRMGKF